MADQGRKKNVPSLPPLDKTKEFDVFLNIPYDDEFKTLYVAYIVGLCLLGFTPRIATEVDSKVSRANKGSRRKKKPRLDKILDLIKECPFSIHDLSRVEVTVGADSTPRFNMPLELGIAVLYQDLYPKRHTWYHFEAKPHRVEHSTSDLNGYDAIIHRGTPEVLLAQLRGTLVRRDPPPFDVMRDSYRLVESKLDSVLAANGLDDPYNHNVFKALCYMALKAPATIGA